MKDEDDLVFDFCIGALMMMIVLALWATKVDFGFILYWLGILK